MLSLSVFPLSVCFLSSAFVPLPATQLSVSSVPFFLFPPRSGFSSASVLPFGFPVFRLLCRPVSRAAFPVSGTWLSVRFLSSLPASLPQLFHRCFPSFPLPLVRFSSGLFRLLSTFFRPLQPASDYSASCAFFSLLPVSPGSGSFGARFSSSVRPVSMPSFRFRYSAFCISFLRTPSRLTVATPAPQPSPLRFPASSPWLSL